MSIKENSKKINRDVVVIKRGNGCNLSAVIREVKGGKVVFECVSTGVDYLPDDIIDSVLIEMGGELAFQGKILVEAAISLSGTTVYQGQLKGVWTLPEFSKEEFVKNAATLLEEHTVLWAKENECRQSFLTAVRDFEVYLEGLESWCKQVECGSLGCPEEREQAIMEEVGSTVSLEVASHFAAYEREVLALRPEERTQHREYLMRVLHRFILQSPFSERCFSKPLGYAGDYGMVELMLGNPYQGRSLFAKLLNNAFLETGPVQAHQNRILYLLSTLKEVVSARVAQGLRTRILNLGCGPADEVRRFIETEEISQMCDFELLDFSSITLNYTKGKIAESCENADRQVNVEFVEQSIQGFLKQAARGERFLAESYDLVYCAGLFDYLTQPFCKKVTSILYDLAKKGGMVVVTNVSKHNTIPAVMEDFLEWDIIDRSEEEMLALVPSEKSELLKDLKSDITRINLFLELRKAVVRANDVSPNEVINESAGARPGVPLKVRG